MKKLEETGFDYLFVVVADWRCWFIPAAEVNGRSGLPDVPDIPDDDRRRPVTEWKTRSSVRLRFMIAFRAGGIRAISPLAGLGRVHGVWYMWTVLKMEPRVIVN